MPWKPLAFSVGLLSVFALGFALPSQVHALRCGMRLVTVGDSATYVRSVCGEPTSTHRSSVSRSRTVYAPIVGGGVVGDRVEVTVEVETWIYDFGRRRFMEELVFEDGDLVRMRPLSYGRGASLERAPADARWAARATPWIDRPRRAG